MEGSDSELIHSGKGLNEFSRRDAFDLLKRLAECIDAAVANFLGNGCNRQRAVNHQILCYFDPVPHLKLMGRSMPALLFRLSSMHTVFSYSGSSIWIFRKSWRKLAHLVGGGYFTPWNIVLAAAVIVAIPTLILFFVAQKYLVEGIKMSGIK